MQEDINLTHRLGQFRSATAHRAMEPQAPRTHAAQERAMSRDGFRDLSYGLFAVFFAAQFLLMGWFLFD
jgi:hypothetical protein